MSDPTFGMSITRVDNEPRAAVFADMAVGGLVVIAPNANAERFPLLTNVLVFSDDPTLPIALGSAGTIKGQIELVNSQLGEFQVAARIVIVRVEAGANEAETMENLIEGIRVLERAGPELGVVPRLIGVPGYTWQQEDGLGSLTLTAQGANLTSAPTVSFSGGGSAPGKVLPTAHAVLGSGATAGKVVSLVIDSAGADLSGSLTVAFSGGGSEGGKVLPSATATIETLANPICVALPSTLNKLVAHAPVSGPHSTLQAYTDWRETLASDRLIPVETWVKIGSPAQTIDSVGGVIGIGIRRDHEKQGRPFHSWANQPMQGIVGPNRPLSFSLTDGSTEAQSILALNGGVILRGEAGVETAIASGGFIFVGTDNAGTDDLWRFYNVTRGRDFIHLMLLKTLRFYLGRFNLNGQTIQAVINTMNLGLRDLQADGDILGFKVGFTRDQNSPENLRAGRFTVDFAAEEAPVLRYLGIRSSRYRPALDALLDSLLTQIDNGI